MSIEEDINTALDILMDNCINNKEMTATEIKHLKQPVMLILENLILAKDNYEGCFVVAMETRISKDTIKVKIEELNKIIEEKRIKNKILNNATKYDYLLIGKRDALQELLEEKEVKQ